LGLTFEQYGLQVKRQEKAVTDLRAGGSLLHAIARAYYLVYVTASYAATVHGLTANHVRQGKEVVERDDFSHNSIPDVVEALYSGTSEEGSPPDERQASDRDISPNARLPRRRICSKGTEKTPTTALRSWRNHTLWNRLTSGFVGRTCWSRI
jgi:hypothetical protein